MSFGAGRSSQEEIDDEQETTEDNGWDMQQSQDGHDSASPSVEDSAASSTQQAKMLLPMQKRRRVTRACDECRRKKIKCDGKQPCTHCTVYSYDCTYDQPSNRRRNPTPQYIESLEIRLQRAETLLRTLLPEIDLSNPYADSRVSQLMRGPAESSVIDSRIATAEIGSSTARGTASSDNGTDSVLESMVDNTAHLDLDDQGHWDFHGHSSGLAFLRRMRQQFGELLGPEAGTVPFLKTRSINQKLESPKPKIESPIDTNILSELPSRKCARMLCEHALDDACALLRFVHQPSFYSSFDRIYDTPLEQFTDEDNRFLPLLYIVLALGCLFAKAQQSPLEKSGFESAIDHGFKYFSAGRHLMDITDCRDLTSIQAVVFMIMFLQCSARLSTCYSFIGIALRSSLRMGLHRSVLVNFDPIEREVRKRVFWVIMKMDVYVGALLGLPRTLHEDDVDQELPLEVNDEFITKERILPMPEGQFSLVAATNAQIRLMLILTRVIKYIYPIKGLEGTMHGRSNQSYAVSHARIMELERDLQEWMENLPMPLRPGGEVSPKLARVQQLLRMAYAHVQMVLYRPFLHYVSQNRQSKSIDKRSYACAAACVSVSRNVVHITGEMKRRGLLIGAFWFTMYTTFFAILSLVYFILENPDDPTNEGLLRDAYHGKETLASLAKRSMAADRCTTTLSTLFDQLPDRLKRSRSGSAPLKTKKRHATSPNPTSRPSILQPQPTAPKVNTSPEHLDARSNLTRERASFPYDNLCISATDPLESIHRRSSPNVTYTPSSLAENRVTASPESTISHQKNRPQTRPQTFPQQLQTQPPFGPHDIPDLSATMFPSADPFAYPNQPMTSLESGPYKRSPHQNYNALSPNNPNTSPMYFPGTGGSGNGYDSLEVQLFGPLPSYLMQGQQGQLQPGNILNMPAQQAVPSGMMGMADDIHSQQLRMASTPALNYNELFGGEDWTGLMDPAYRQ
ncbi:MAG: hypothetical protein M1812_004479 [Candelaria pacifica]|nr:MAG: hypothetical protein M1812_004479 [Candelaria pacifica]